MAPSVEPSDLIASSDGATYALWQRVEQPVDAPLALAALFGVELTVAARYTAISVLNSVEVQSLVARLPDLTRSPDQTLAVRFQRTMGDLRGPVNWGETIAARATSGGAPDVLVCGSPARASDTPLNRVLVTVLDRLSRLGNQLGTEPGDERLVCARAAATSARRAATTRQLADVPRNRIAASDVTRARRSRAATRYDPMFAVLERLKNPLTPTELATVTDAPTSLRHALLGAVLDGLTARGVLVTPLSCRGGLVTSGPVRFRHVLRSSERTTPPGVSIAGIGIDVGDGAPGWTEPGSMGVSSQAELDVLLDQYTISASERR